MQSGSDEILRRMNRHYTKESYMELVRKGKSGNAGYHPEHGYHRGFPGKRGGFQRNLDVIRKSRYSTAFTFIYSKRTGTPAATMENQVPEDVIKDRFDRMLNILNPIVHEVHEEQLGKVMTVFAEEASKQDKTVLTGRADNNMLVHFKGTEDLIGQMVPVKITENKNILFNRRKDVR